MQVDWLMLFTIFSINVVYVTLNTIRMMLTMKGYQLIAPFLAMIEITIYVVGLGLVLDRLDNIWNIVAYALGFGVGIFAGMKMEDKLALGYILVTAIVPATSMEKNVPEELRARGYGVTASPANGREGGREVLEILTPRKNERQLYEEIRQIEPKAFVISYEPKYISGGFWTKQVRKRRKRIKQMEQMNENV
ncbi:DUF2179 domain-containing protein [Atopococcus tabaci]|uniref:DUF2179 domain-containing protein n=1 Tax=Atopococcus tabaci TaxID=269774 RepID=UPI0024093A0A|nr:DUF2179 domain-containing protein [Atopococcus tabaci]